MKVDREELYWEQRAQANWLKNRDRNTHFFHQSATDRSRKNKVEELVDGEGNSYANNDALLRLATDYFTSLFTAKSVGDPSSILEGVEPCISQQMNEDLEKEFTYEEVCSTLKAMSPLKASSEDGIGAIFYHRFWHIVGKDVANFCIETMQGFQKILNVCIDEAQSAFVLGRLITDNIIAAYETLHSMKRKRIGRKGWIEKVMGCVTSVSYSVVMNGEVYELFFPSQGLRQGDPISPYLFLICDEGLSTLLRRAVSRGVLNGFRVSRQAPRITHLFFTNDSLIFGDASINGAMVIKEILEAYAKCSGQEVNLDKSGSFLSSNVDQFNRDNVCRVLGVNRNLNLENYLGLPSMVGLCRDLEAVMARFWWQKKAGKKGLHWCSWKKLSVPKEEGGMGFRDLAKFNIALLAKQGWHLMENLSSLLARLLKAKYYRGSDFMEASLGANPSFFWRSIWCAKGLLGSGLKWRIGSGTSMSI
ncbi:uncharacterized protein LOC105787003 [Gossypium raimondii]|uniref:uncharacterized protein LOC105787003 n=1 Tax=Gossypium raimondii TaxID=29730 RepID=UPI00227C17FF|nr:uncharacterized protein LOC105787003 [Gossypium raimondii]